MVVRLPEIKKYLNRDGLEEYNSLLPHSSTEIEEYVADWLDAHPEATTTVQDGSITTQKLADASVTRNKLAADVAHLLGGMMITGEVQGEMLSANDAYSVSPLSMEVYGKSTQNGRPTPDSPIPIESIEVLELPVTFAGKNMFNKNNVTANRYINDSGTFSSWNKASASEFIPVKPNTTYTLQFGAAPGNNRVAFYTQASDTTFISPTLTFSSTTFTFTTPEDAAYLRFSCYTTVLDSAQLEMGNAATSYEPYVEPIIVSIPMQGNVLRSLPDGTCDTMSLSYLRESDRTGWAWYTPTLTKRIGEITFNAFATFTNRPNVNAKDFRPAPSAIASSAVYMSTSSGHANRMLCNSFVVASDLTTVPSSAGYNNCCSYQQSTRYALFRLDSDEYPDLETANAWLANNPITILLEYLDNYVPDPITLDPIELPVLSAPNVTVWSDPATGLKMSYMRDASIVISDMEQAIADL